LNTVGIGSIQRYGAQLRISVMSNAEISVRFAPKYTYVPRRTSTRHPVLCFLHGAFRDLDDWVQIAELSHLKNPSKGVVLLEELPAYHTNQSERV
jgi:hypothetical protein